MQLTQEHSGGQVWHAFGCHNDAWRQLTETIFYQPLEDGL